MNPIDIFMQTKECVYKGNIYSVRDNGAVFRHAKGKRYKNDNCWSFGTLNHKNGYLYLGSARVHRIVAMAFLGEPPTKEHIIDHIDTNRQNNRPENLRYLTRLENALLNPLTRQKIIHYCGSIEAFLKNPKILRERALANESQNFQWMRQVSTEEAQNCLKNLEHLFLQRKQAKKEYSYQNKGIGEWIYKPFTKFTKSIQDDFYDTQAISPANAKQRDWRTPSEFPLCPKPKEVNPLEAYAKNMQKDKVFSNNQYGSSVIVEYALLQNSTIQKSLMQNKEDSRIDENALFVLCKFEPPNVKKYSLAKVTYENDCFIHIALGTYFDERGGRKYFTLAQGLEWKGGEVFDDYC
ncbi:HNH endonuclease signature motif containing protein [uncultured Helicobacter sp.]|uniref:HNH endonuclease signature motif containing protein n=1 Tax=uncultured Helicobacter sp. TaxID=175537 RepID=UPI0026103E42|nr:HNH endonuclease signature motif containing protein [uncultured Helicobacter sp.]